MEKLFNQISVSAGCVGGVLFGLLGGWDVLLKALIIVMCLDYLTGILKAIYEKKLSSEIGAKGIIKKVMYLILIALVVEVEEITGIEIARSSIICFFFANEGISICENASMFLPIPQKLKDLLIQLRDKNEKSDDYEK